MVEQKLGFWQKSLKQLRSGFWRNWIEFFSELWQRLVRPVGQPALIFYFVGIMLIVGGLGVSISVFERTPAPAGMAVPRALAVYLFAILAAAFVDLNLEDETTRSLRMFALLVLVVGTVGGVVSFVVTDVRWAYRSAVGGTLLALFLWWVANAKNERFFEPLAPPTAAIAGEPQEPVGSLKGIQS
jgi:hypothetical protein